MHYGILGMKWGVRRTPEQLGHKKAEQRERTLKVLKEQRIARIEKAYSKPIRRLAKMRYGNPYDTSIKKRLKDLEYYKKKDIAKVKAMDYDDMAEAMREDSQRIIKSVGKEALRVAGAVAMYNLIGFGFVRIPFKSIRERRDGTDLINKGRQNFPNLDDIEDDK